MQVRVEFEHRPGAQVVLVEETEAHIVAGEEELDDRLAVGTAGFVEADRATLYTIKMRPGIARPE